MDRADARSRLTVPQDAFVLLFGADSLQDKRKGLDDFQRALAVANLPKRTMILFFGRYGVPDALHGIPCRGLGHLACESYLVPAYSAADVYVMPSLQEAFGQTALEAMACGTPVVAYNVGGISDVVVSGHTGLFARVGDSTDLAEKIEVLAENPALRRILAANARKLATQEYTLERQASKYLNLYREICPTEKVTNGG